MPWRRWNSTQRPPRAAEPLLDAVGPAFTRDWPEAERLEFARLLIKYVDAIADLQQAPGNG
ncbi:hypothetical protein ACFW5I_07985 [Streptomyces sp. NPDC058818]|uniref:hypothetical protein n=1 Tax=Streptomyces sp. NPDC058818 TaxID=3346640 RepID=UPI0036B2BB2F